MTRTLSKNEKKFKWVYNYIIKINLPLTPHSRGNYHLISWTSSPNLPCMLMYLPTCLPIYLSTYLFIYSSFCLYVVNLLFSCFSPQLSAWHVGTSQRFYPLLLLVDFSYVSLWIFLFSILRQQLGLHCVTFLAVTCPPLLTITASDPLSEWTLTWSKAEVSTLTVL